MHCFIFRKTTIRPQAQQLHNCLDGNILDILNIVSWNFSRKPVNTENLPGNICTIHTKHSDLVNLIRPISMMGLMTGPWRKVMWGIFLQQLIFAFCQIITKQSGILNLNIFKKQKGTNMWYFNQILLTLPKSKSNVIKCRHIRSDDTTRNLQDRKKSIKSLSQNNETSGLSQTSTTQKLCAIEISYFKKFFLKRWENRFRQNQNR